MTVSSTGYGVKRSKLVVDKIRSDLEWEEAKIVGYFLTISERVNELLHFYLLFLAHGYSPTRSLSRYLSSA